MPYGNETAYREREREMRIKNMYLFIYIKLGDVILLNKAHNFSDSASEGPPSNASDEPNGPKLRYLKAQLVASSGPKQQLGTFQVAESTRWLERWLERVWGPNTDILHKLSDNGEKVAI